MRAVTDIDGKIKAIGPENLHLTLKFLGDTRTDLVDDIHRVMVDSVKGVPPFDMTLKGCGAFPDRGRPRVLWVGCQGAGPLTGIAAKMDEGVSRLGFKREKRGFAAHLTVARVRFTKDKQGLRDFFSKFDDMDHGTVKVDRIKLKKSVLSPRGATYSTVSEVELGE